MRLAVIAFITAAAVALPLAARVYMTREQALAAAFLPGVRVTRQALFLETAEVGAVRNESGAPFEGALVVRYAGSDGSFAYFDTHRVRTMPETVMMVVGADQKVRSIEILSFDEPSDYYPKRRWLDQFLHRSLSRDLSLSGAIRPMSGASLTGRAITDASRRVLAIHRVLGARTP